MFGINPIYFLIFCYIQGQELLSIIAAVEVTVSELEQELVALHFQLSQERNERRLAEYRLRHPSPRSMSPRPSSIMKLPISSSRMSADHPRWVSNWGINSWEVNLFYWHMPCTCNHLDIWEVVLGLKTSDLKCGDFLSYQLTIHLPSLVYVSTKQKR
ncbi:hypothetical protein ABKV19_027007 [Rosa sericea]